ncbi:hypothetical protein DS901_03235 [Loktanella sp. D2R18]|uniref:hypothetical protein n=1 Tax=Rhodobacterales TaxID=204455 RepID=UPI000DE85455|nr:MULTISPECIES: hypothetical protein [Rhodobacterales]MDO6589330.1 hypothetical protein [Yoonia sp. 1_MG-2023]RBW45255.1 hypothetical protein DS901_03235 [Loktanella sp. D2R18]
MNYLELIITCEHELNTLHGALHATLEDREKSASHREKWVRAAKAFRAYDSPVFELADQCRRFGIKSAPELRAFVFAYIQCDPYFYRSGYILEQLLPKVKQLSLSEFEKGVIQRTILKRIETKALRNFRHLCKLIHYVDDAPFRDALRARANSSDTQMRRRAKFALAYLPD